MCPLLCPTRNRHTVRVGHFFSLYVNGIYMQHPVELQLTALLRQMESGAVEFSKENKERLFKDLRTSVERDFSGIDKREFHFRMSNIGRPYCQLWFQKNHPEIARAPTNGMIFKFFLGDAVEALFLGLLREADIEYGETQKVVLELAGREVVGHYDLSLNGAIDDVKSASSYAYNVKFHSFASLQKDDNFGYVAQLAAYAKATGQKAGGWWVIDKTSGSFKYVPAEGLDVEAELANVEAKMYELDKNVFRRCFEDEEETFRSVPTGNRKLCFTCGWCDYKDHCWDIERLPATNSKAQNPQIVEYTYVDPKNR